MTDAAATRGPDAPDADAAAPGAGGEAPTAPPPGDAAREAAPNGARSLQDQLTGAFGGGAPASAGVMDVPVTLTAVLGAARLPVSRYLELKEGDTLALDRAVGEPIEIAVNGTVIGRGEIVLVDEDAGRLGVRVVSLSGA